MIGVIGSGSWATAIVKILLEQTDRRVNWWVRNEKVRTGLLSDGHNPVHLPDVELDTSRLDISGDLAEVVGKSEYLFLVTPSAFIANVLEQLPKSVYKGKKFVSAIKGIIPERRISVSVYLESIVKVKRNDRLRVVSMPVEKEEETAPDAPAGES